MTLSLYTISLPVLDSALSNLEHVLKKGEAHAIERNLDPEVLLRDRLFPDMFSLVGQVQVATALAKACPFRVTGQEPPNYEDNEHTFEDCYARIARARKDIGQFSAQDIDDQVAREFSLKMGPTVREFTSLSYVNGFILPNVYFHCTTAYNILRHNGVPLGKRDFFGA